MEKTSSFPAGSRLASSIRRMRPRGLILPSIVLILAVLLGIDIYTRLGASDPRMSGALWGGMVAAGATALGAVPVLLNVRLSQRAHDGMLGFGAGVMLAASSFSLIVPALAAAAAQGLGRWEAGSLVGSGVMLGALALLLIDRAVPHEHFIKGVEGAHGKKLKRVWLFVLAICLHNFPEGLAIGVGFTGPDRVGAQALAVGIAVQDFPEGMVVALALSAVGYSRRVSVGMGVLSGLIEPLAAVIGVAVISLSEQLLPWGLAAAAGAMLFVISHEIIPESHRQGHEAYATGGLIVGFVAMMLLDTALG